MWICHWIQNIYIFLKWDNIQYDIGWQYWIETFNLIYFFEKETLQKLNCYNFILWLCFAPDQCSILGIINYFCETKGTYCELSPNQSLNRPNQMFKQVMWVQIGWGKRPTKEVVSSRKEIWDRQGEEAEEFLRWIECVGSRKVTETRPDKNWRKLPNEDTVTSTLNV